MNRVIRTLAVLGAALASGWAAPGALAASQTFDNETEVAYYSGTSATSSHGSYWDTTPSGGIGAPTYATPSVTIGMTSTGGPSGTTTVTIAFSTGFYAGIDNSLGVPVYGADIFIESKGSTTPSDNYNYAIALGFDTPEGGESTKGLYSLPTSGGNVLSSAYDTSQQIWGGRSGYTYGGLYAPLGDCSTSSDPQTHPCSDANLSPTVLLKNGGSTDIDSSVSVNGVDTDGDLGTLTVTLTGATSLLAPIFSDFDLFWGTGDCSNAPIWVDDVTFNTAVPEPSTLALLATALALAIAYERRRRRALPLPFA